MILLIYAEQKVLNYKTVVLFIVAKLSQAAFLLRPLITSKRRIMIF